MQSKTVEEKRAIEQGRPVAVNNAINAEAQLSQEPTIVRPQAQEMEVSANPGTEVSAHQGAKVSTHHGAEVSAHQGTKVSANPGTKVSANSGTKVFTHPEVKVSAHQGTKVSANPGREIFTHPGAKVSANPGTKVSANPGTKVSTHHGAEVSAHQGAKVSTHPITKFSAHPETEVTERPSRKKYSAKYKLQILNEIDSSVKTGEIGAVLRREGLYSSTVANWRMQKEKGQLEGLSPKKRGPKSNLPDSRDKQIKELELQNRKLQRKLTRAHLLLDIQKKISEMTGISLSEMEDEKDD